LVVDRAYPRDRGLPSWPRSLLGADGRYSATLHAFADEDVACLLQS